MIDLHIGDVPLQKLIKGSFYGQNIFKYCLASYYYCWLIIVCINILRFSVITTALNQGSAAMDLVFFVNFMPYQVFLLLIG
jgi:hypothetical protein